MKTEKKKKKRKKIRVVGILVLILFAYLIGMIIYYFFTMHVKNIIVKNNDLVTESKVIEKTGITTDMELFKVNGFSVKNKLLKEIPLIEDVKVSKSMTGNVVITINESKILFYDTINNVIVLSNGKKVNEVEDYIGYATLINKLDDKIYDSLIKGLSKLDKDTLMMISEIEYSPEKYDDLVVDAERFLLRMNDGNMVYINMVNIEKLNKYQTIYSGINGKGILYLDSNNKNYIFKNYDETKIEEEPKVEESEVKKDEN